MTKRQTFLMLIMSLAIAFAASKLSAQAIQPDPKEDHPTLSPCRGPGSVMSEESIQFETFMTSAVNLSPQAVTATLPLRRGYLGAGTSFPVYYVLTDSSDCNTAQQLGINYSAKLAKTLDANGNPIGKSVQKVTIDGNGAIHFAATANFKNAAAPNGPNIRTFVANTAATPNFFDPVDEGATQGSSVTAWPATTFAPGSVGDPNYTPLITYTTTAGQHIVLNAPQVANSTGVKDFIPAIDYTNMTVTFNLVHGIYNFHFVMYLRMDATNPLISAFEGGIYAPNLNDAPINGDRSANSARQTILPVINGLRGVDKIFDRQGVQSGALLEGDPNNVMGAKPGEDQDYSPLWDITPPVWTAAAVNAGKRQRLHQDDEVASFIAAGDIQSWAPASGNFNPDFKGPLVQNGLQSLGIVSNCPIMLRVLKGLPAFAGGK
jgi:hypothetical protein